MIRVKVELEPYGMTIGGKQLAEIRIWNSTGRGYTSKHNYEFEMMEPDPLAGDPVMCRGSINGYDRQQPVLNLVSKVLQEALDKA